MRHIGDIMEELGFRKDAPEETSAAFLKHLMKAAGQAEAHIQEKENELKGEQLSFSFEALEAYRSEPKKKNVG